MKLPLYNRKLEVVTHALVDADDFEHLSRWRWNLHRQGYASRMVYAKGAKTECLLLHRAVTDAPTGTHVHHRNRVRLDCRRANLEVLDPGDHIRLHAALRREAALALA